MSTKQSLLEYYRCLHRGEVLAIPAADRQTDHLHTHQTPPAPGKKQAAKKTEI